MSEEVDSQKFPERIAQTIAQNIFLPIDANYTRLFNKPLRILVLTFFIFLLFLALPPVVDYLTGPSTIVPSLIDKIEANSSLLNYWLPFVSFSLEIFFIILVGGSVFGEWFALLSKDTLQKLQDAIIAARQEEIVDSSDELEEKIRDYFRLLIGITFRNFIPRIWELYLISNSILFFALKELPKVNAKFIVTKMSIAFPGGLYGLLSFIVFSIYSFLRVIDFYVKAVSL